MLCFNLIQSCLKTPLLLAYMTKHLLINSSEIKYPGNDQQLPSPNVWLAADPVLATRIDASLALLTT